MVGRYPASLSHNPAGPSRPQRPSSQRSSKQPSQRPSQRQASMISSSIDDEVPMPPELPPLPQPQLPAQLPELASLEILLQQAGYKETRVFTPEAERIRQRQLKTRLDEETAELANLYAAMGLDPAASVQVRHMTQPAIPLRSSSSVLRNVALQDATSLVNDARRRRGEPEEPIVADTFWRPDILDRAAAEAVGRSVAAMSPPRVNKWADSVGLRLAHEGRGVRKAQSNYELVRTPDKEDVPPAPRNVQRPLPPAQPVYSSALERQVPPSIAAMFSPPTEMRTELPQQYIDDAFGWGQLPSDYETQEDDDMYADAIYSDSVECDSTPGTSPPFSNGAMSPPALMDEQDVYASLGMGADSDGDSLADADEIAQAEREAAAIGQRILASTVEYDDESDESDDGALDNSPTPNAMTVPAINVMSPSPPARVPMLASSPARPSAKPPPLPKRVPPRAPLAPELMKQATPPRRAPRRFMSRADSLAEAMAESILSPTRRTAAQRVPVEVVVQPSTPLRTAKSAPALRRARSGMPFAITPAVIAAPALQTVVPIVCDSISNDAEDLPPLPIPPMNDPEPAGFGSLALRARKSLTALRASFWKSEETLPPPIPDISELPLGSTAPILAPRLDWRTQGTQFAGWNADQDEKQDKKVAKARSRDSLDSTASDGTVRERRMLDDPFDDGSDPIDYTKSFFYKPATPPGRPSMAAARNVLKPRKQQSVKSLRRALLSAGPPVPKIPAEFLQPARSSTDGARTPPRMHHPPILQIHSPGAWEEGRPARPLVLEGEEWEGHDVVENWGEGVRRKTKRAKSKRARRLEDEF